MLASVEHLLKTEFGSSLSPPGVKILDPCTGNFIVNLLRHHLTRRVRYHRSGAPALLGTEPCAARFP